MFRGSNERRASSRYSITADLSYSCSGVDPGGGQGRLVNVSSGGILFESNGDFRPGMKLRLVIVWPAPAGHCSRLWSASTGVSSVFKGASQPRPLRLTNSSLWPKVPQPIQSLRVVALGRRHSVSGTLSRQDQDHHRSSLPTRLISPQFDDFCVRRPRL